MSNKKIGERKNLRFIRWRNILYTELYLKVGPTFEESCPCITAWPASYEGEEEWASIHGDVTLKRISIATNLQNTLFIYWFYLPTYSYISYTTSFCYICNINGKKITTGIHIYFYYIYVEGYNFNWITM